MSGSNAPHNEPESEREIALTRIIGGPVALVFEVYTQAEHVKHWWGPNGFTITTKSFDFRVGGSWEFMMHGPDGANFPNHVTWREITKDARLVYTHGARAGDPDAFTSTILFAAHGPAATEIRTRAVFPTRARKQLAVEKFHAVEGGQQHLANLDAYVTRDLTTKENT